MSRQSKNCSSAQQGSLDIKTARLMPTKGSLYPICWGFLKSPQPPSNYLQQFPRRHTSKINENSNSLITINHCVCIQYPDILQFLLINARDYPIWKGKLYWVTTEPECMRYYGTFTRSDCKHQKGRPQAHLPERPLKAKPVF